jgi:hypothetical protein
MNGSWDSLTASIGEVARRTGESQWTVKDKLRRGTYLGKKSGRRTLVVVESVKKHIDELPDAVFAPAR